MFFYIKGDSFQQSCISNFRSSNFGLRSKKKIKKERGEIMTEIELDDIVFELLEEKHWNLYRQIKGNPNVQRYNNTNIGSTLSGMRNSFRKSINKEKKIFSYFAVKIKNFSIIKKDKDGIILKKSFFPEKDVALISFFKGETKTSVSLSYFLIESCHGMGLGTEIVKGMINFLLYVKKRAEKSEESLFSSWDHIEALVHKENIPSQAVLGKLGFKKKTNEVFLGRGMEGIAFERDIMESFIE